VTAGTAVRVVADRDRAEELGLVLAAADIPHWFRRRLDGWALIVSPSDAPRALAGLDAYERENPPSLTRAADAPAPARPLTLAGAYVALLLIACFGVSGPRAGQSEWFQRGSADAARMLDGEWWRAVTALTLHADAPHLLGNVVAGALLVTAVCQPLGSGVGLALLLLAGATGNALTAAVHRGGHVSVGASTLIFAAVGILATLRVTTPPRTRSRWGTLWVALTASLALLALLGTGPNADVLAHAFGLLAGLLAGLVGAVAVRRPAPAFVQGLLVASAGGAVTAAWLLAF
jgi:membrane associated rhomboid family serine protease